MTTKLADIEAGLILAGVPKGLSQAITVDKDVTLTKEQVVVAFQKMLAEHPIIDKLVTQATEAQAKLDALMAAPEMDGGR